MSIFIAKKYGIALCFFLDILRILIIIRSFNMSIFIKFSNINGSATETNHKGWSNADAVYFNCSRKISHKIGHNYNREVSMPNLNEVEIFKDNDSSSSQIFRQLIEGKPLDQVQIHFCHTGKNLETNKEYVLHDVLISRYQDTSLSDANHAGKEYIKLSFVKIETRFTPYDSTGKAGSPLSVGYDLSTAQST